MGRNPSDWCSLSASAIRMSWQLKQMVLAYSATILGWGVKEQLLYWYASYKLKIDVQKKEEKNEM